jgi:Spy/CpxP family protein refolding chaperone
MNARNQSSLLSAKFGRALAIAGVWLAPALATLAQPANPPDHSAHQHTAAPAATAPAVKPADPLLAQQLAELRAKVAALEATVGQAGMNSAGGAPMTGSGMAGMGKSMGSGRMPSGMGGAGGMSNMGSAGGGMSGGGQGGMMGEMGMMSGMMPAMGASGGMQGNASGGMSGMPAQGMSGGMKDMMGMMGMMGMAPSGSMATTAALPGFPGASHIYHVGGTDFFLDHGQHIGLTVAQRTTLGHLKEKTTLEQASLDRKVEQAEQELWTLTAADQPDASTIEAKVTEIEKVRGDKRLAFIRAVGEAAKVLTPEQRQILLGLKAPVPATPGTMPGMGGGSMGHM